MELVGALLIPLWMFSWREGWWGWLAALAVALVGGISLCLALAVLWAESISASFSGKGDDSPVLFWTLFVGVAGILSMGRRICRGVRRSYVDGLDAAGVPRRRGHGETAALGQAEADGDGPHGRGLRIE